MTDVLYEWSVMRVFNQNRNSLLLFRYKSTGVWGLPLIDTPDDSDPVEIASGLLKEVVIKPDFRLVALLPFLRQENEETKAGKDILYRLQIYDLQYEGAVKQVVPPHQTDIFNCCRWISIPNFLAMKGLNKPAGAVATAMEKKACLH